MFEKFKLFKDLFRMLARHKAYYFFPLLLLIIIGIFIIVVLESPALIPFFYAIF